MRQTVCAMIAILLISSGAAIAANLTWHKMSWLRRPLPPAAAPSSGSSANQVPLRAGEADTAGAAQAEQDAKPAEASGGFVSIERVLMHLRNGTAFFVDARKPEEYQEGHLRDVIHLPSNALYANIDRLTDMVAPDETVIIYCAGGECEASHSVADALRRDFGFTNVWIYKNGWEEIESSGRFDEFIVRGEDS